MKYIKNNLMIYIFTVIHFIITLFIDNHFLKDIDNKNYIIVFIILLVLWHLIFYLIRKKYMIHLFNLLIPITIVLLVTNVKTDILDTLSMMLIPNSSFNIVIHTIILSILITSILACIKDSYKYLVTLLFIIGITTIYLLNILPKTYLFIGYYIVIIYYIIYMLIRKKNRVLFISSTGGHLEELFQLKPTMEKHDYFIITERNKTNEILKEKYKGRVGYLVYGTRKNIIKYAFVMFINFFRSFAYYLKVKPNIIITTGTHTAVMMCYIGKFFGAKVVYIETFANRESKTLAGRLVYPIADLFIVQWKEMLKKYPKAQYFGGVY